jgi:hypothetical protein
MGVIKVSYKSAWEYGLGMIISFRGYIDEKLDGLIVIGVNYYMS